MKIKKGKANETKRNYVKSNKIRVKLFDVTVPVC